MKDAGPVSDIASYLDSILSKPYFMDVAGRTIGEREGFFVRVVWPRKALDGRVTKAISESGCGVQRGSLCREEWRKVEGVADWGD